MNIAVSVARPLEETPGLSSTQEQERMVHTRREYNRITVTSSVICVVCIVGFVLAPLLFDAINISQLDYDSASVKIIKDKPSIIETYHQLRTNDVNRSRVGENPDSNSVCDPRNFLVLIKSGSISQYQNRRTIWRKSSCPTTYTRYGLKYHFMLGMPSHAIIDPNSHNQAKRATDEERKDMSYLQAESNKHKDMIFLSLRDVYEDFAFKTLRILEWAAERGMSNTTSVVVLQDDEYCLQPEILERICVQHSSRSTSAASRRSILYTGVYFWDKAYSDIQKGLDGTFVPYFSGHMFGLSSDIVRDIANDPESVFMMKSFGFSEDLLVGRWVKSQADKQGKNVSYVAESSLSWEVPDTQDKRKSSINGVWKSLDPGV